MRSTTIGILAVSVIAFAGCGSGTKFANRPRPATPVDLTVYINNSRVLVSPDSVGAGPVNFIVTNQSAKTQAISIADAITGHGFASTGPITPQATTQVTVDFTKPGDFTVSIGGQAGKTDASRALPNNVQGASLHIGRARPSAANVLLQP